MRRLLLWMPVVLLPTVFLGIQVLGETTYFTSYLASTLFAHNAHEILPGRLYRSGEMPGEQALSFIQKNKIKTVVDLRLGPNEEDDGNLTEKWLNILEGGNYFQVPMSGSKPPTTEQFQRLVNVFDRAEEPVWIHCSSGTHRSGFAAYVWLLEKANRTVQEASRQLSAVYGYYYLERQFKGWVQGKATLDTIVWDYQKYYLANQAKGDTPQSFREWLIPRLHATSDTSSTKTGCAGG